MAGEAVGDGTNGSEIEMSFTERYYEPYDTFEVCDTKQQFFVMEAPIRKADDFWTYSVRVLTNDREETLVTGSAYAGAKTRWIGNIQVEYHEQGKNISVALLNKINSFNCWKPVKWQSAAKILELE